jgi:hypothetical protein
MAEYAMPRRMFCYAAVHMGPAVSLLDGVRTRLLCATQGQLHVTRFG